MDAAGFTLFKWDQGLESQCPLTRSKETAMRRIFLAALLIVSAPVQSEGIQEGEWEFSNTMKMGATPGMPDMSEIAKQLPPGMKLPGIELNGGAGGGITMKAKHCVTNDNPTPPVKNQDRMKCEMTDQKREGQRFEWTMHCTGDKTDFTSVGVATYTGAAMTSEVNMKGTVEGAPTEIAMNTTGKYLGPCPAKK